jgi:hypothetical protein
MLDFRCSCLRYAIAEIPKFGNLFIKLGNQSSKKGKRRAFIATLSGSSNGAP